MEGLPTFGGFERRIALFDSKIVQNSCELWENGRITRYPVQSILTITSATTPPGGPETEIILRSEKLFAAKTEIVIVHNGERYRLRLTRRGKLLLQK